MPTGVYKRTEFHIKKMKEGFAKISKNSDWREKQKVRRLGKKHSTQTRLKMSKVQSGEKAVWFGKDGEGHPRWIKDRTKLAKRQERNDMAYIEWRKQVWLRDNFKYKIANPDCNGRIEAHHILSWSQYPQLRYEVNNGITLCHFHHPRKRKDEMRLSPYFTSLIIKV